MSFLRSLPRAALFTTACALALGAAPREEVLSSSQVKDLAKLLGEYFEAKAETKGISEVVEELQEEIEDIEKKLKGRKVLSLVDDWERAFVLSAEYTRSIKGKGKVAEIDFAPGNLSYEIQYAVHAPKRYSHTAGPYPLILAIPDEGQTAKQHIDENWVDADLRDEAIVVAIGLPEEAEDSETSFFDRFGSPSEPGVVWHARFILGQVGKDLAYDRSRVFLAGRGRGVAAALEIASHYPHLFAGVIGTAGDAGETPVFNFRNLPTFFTGAGARATAFQEALAELGAENCTLEPEGREPEILAWIQEQRRNSYPHQLTFSPREASARSAYWVTVDGFEPDAARLDASIDVEANRIDLVGEGVSDVVLYFNDALIDMDRPVKVVCNGVLHEETIPRNLAVTLNLASKSRDPGRIFTNAKDYHLPDRAQ